MKRILSTIAILAMIFAVCPALSSSAAANYTAQKPLILKLATFAMPAHPSWAEGLAPLAEELKEKSGGRMILELYSPNTICPDAEVAESVKNGIIDIGAQFSQRVKGTYPLSNVIDLPFMFPSGLVAARVFHDLYDEFPELREEYKDVKFLSCWSGTQWQLHTTKKEMTSIDDVKGLKIGTVTAASVPLIKALGAVAVVVPMTDCYVSLQRGQIDGFFTPYAFMVSTKIYEATKYSLTVNMCASGLPLIMNKETYASMPEDLRAILDDAVSGYKIPDRFAGAIDDGAERDRLLIIEKGQIVKEAPASDIIKARELCRPIVNEWIAECEKRHKGYGAVAQRLYTRAIELGEKHAKELGQM